MKRFTKIPINACLMLLTAVVPAWAVQTHGGAEGLVSHQLGHFLYTVGMAYLLVRIYRIRLQTSGWQEFKVFLWLIIIWNLVTFFGHWMDELVSPAKFVRSVSGISTFNAESLFDFVYYATRLDHLVLVPAFVFLLMALNKWRDAR